MSEESEKTAAILGKIKAKQWKEMGKTVIGLKEFTEVGGLSNLLEGLKETLSLQVQDAFSPLRNEINEQLAELLNPIMPAVVAVVNEAGVYIQMSIKAWVALFTGDWNTFIKWMEDSMSEGLKSWRKDVQNWWADMMKGWEGFWKDLEKGTHGFFADVGKGWSGFWSDLGWK